MGELGCTAHLRHGFDGHVHLSDSHHDGVLYGLVEPGIASARLLLGGRRRNVSVQRRSILVPLDRHEGPPVELLLRERDGTTHEVDIRVCSAEDLMRALTSRTGRVARLLS